MSVGQSLPQLVDELLELLVSNLLDSGKLWPPSYGLSAIV
ncbi:hypothetical protein QFZ43_005527 [Streptomyces afghaniensis]|nr:hypothetical protein [Streptomyces afghaniensis]